MQLIVKYHVKLQAPQSFARSLLTLTKTCREFLFITA